MKNQKTLNNIAMENLNPENMVGEGKWREVFRISPDLCAKRIKKYHPKNYGPFKINFNANLYTLVRSFIKDYNCYELRQYNKIIVNVPAELKNSFADIKGIENDEHGSMLIEEIINDYDGKVSKTMADAGAVKNDGFWRRMDKLREFLLGNGIYFLDLTPGNIVVKQIDKDSKIPVLFDYKRMGYRAYPLQLNLLLKSERRKKLVKCFDRVYNKYKL